MFVEVPRGGGREGGFLGVVGLGDSLLALLGGLGVITRVGG